VVVQLDEPLLPAALEGRLSGVTSLTPVHPVDEPTAISLIDHCIATLGTEVMLHSCAASLPWKLLQRSGIHAVSVDVATLTANDLDGIGELVERERTVLLGVVPSTAPAARPSSEEIAKAAVAITDRLGFPRSVLRERIGVTPACGLAGATAEWARTAIELAQKAAEAFDEDPDAI
jgi:methionine synthase II (cobalamin-independent)